MGGRNHHGGNYDSVVAFPDGGGSNMVFVDIGNYASDNTKWATDVKATLLHYQEYRAQAKARLATMNKQGQTKLSVMLWYVEDGLKCSYYSHVVCPQKGKIAEQVQTNIKNLIQDMNAAKFDTLIFRFGAQSIADPLSENYQIHRIDDSWNLIQETYKVVEAAAKGTKVKVIYDLGVETMGHPYSNRQGAQQFLYTIWNRYAAKYPLDKTVGFTFNHAHDGATDSSLNVYKSNGKWPATIGIDIYEDPDKFLGNLSGALARAGKPNYPVAITETYYNDGEMGNAFRKDKSKVNLQYVLQWPLSKGSNSKNVTSVDTPFINAYITPQTQVVVVTPPPRPRPPGPRPPIIRPPYIVRPHVNGVLIRTGRPGQVYNKTRALNK
jgi:hypothetical protein